MRFFLMIMIKAYWFFVLAEKRSRCIFRQSCSIYVYNVAKRKGFLSGVKALRYRYQNCRPGYQLLSTHNEVILVTRKAQVLSQKEIDPRLLK